MIKYYSTRSQVIHACKLCIDNQLYVPIGSAMRRWYLETIGAQDGDIIKSIAIYFVNNKPVGVCAVLCKHNNYYNCNCGTFVHSNYRRLGIGKKLIETFRKKHIALCPWTGSYVAKQFYTNSI